MRFLRGIYLSNALDSIKHKLFLAVGNLVSKELLKLVWFETLIKTLFPANLVFH